MVRNMTIAAAVAAVLASGTALATAPSPAAAAAPSVGLYIAGSSAAKNAVLAAIETTICGNSYSLFSSTGDTNFFAVSCTPASGVTPGSNGTSIFTIWYRDEGGSVVGALPLVSGSQINQLSLAGASGSGPTNYTVAVAGSSGINGIDDSFASGVFKAPVQFGITDVEPAALVKDNYPTAYKTSVYGKATPAQLAALNATTLFDQVFGIFVNTNSTAFSSTEAQNQGTSPGKNGLGLNLPVAAITNILQGNSVNWNDVPDTNGNVVTTASLPIVIVNREQGSGSRTATSIFFTDDECNSSATSIAESTGGTADYFSTGNVLAAANTIPGSISYASIDNAGSTSFPNLTLVSVGGVVPTQLTAAAGEYNDWFEATGVTGSATLSADQTALINTLISSFSTQATAPNSADILAIPSLTNAPGLPISATLANKIYVNAFTRSGLSCNSPGTAL
jgi:hypothetical protein